MAIKLKFELREPHQELGGGTQVFRKGKQLLIPLWHPSC